MNSKRTKQEMIGREQQMKNWALMGVAGIAALLASGHLEADQQKRGETRYQQTNLVSDQPGVAMLQDTNLVNAWGISFSASSPFWISDNGTGLSTLYVVTNDSAGAVQVVKQPLEVRIPGEGNPTGQVFDGTGSFHSNIFIFASEDGTISGWHPALGTAAEVLATRGGAVYKGITLARTADGPRLLAANFAEGTIDVYATNSAGATLVARYTDSTAPAGYAPFNVQNVNGFVFVTFAQQDAAKEDDVAGRGHGLISVLNPQNGMFRRFATGTAAGGTVEAMNSPWGIALAPPSFGRHADELLVGNFGAGTIMAFDARGKFRGLLKAVGGGPVVIPGLWGLAFGNGGRAGNPHTLYFTAGPDDESHGLFGSLTAVAPGNAH